MERTLATVDSNGQLILPAQIQSALGFTAGTEVEILADGNCLTLSRKRTPISPEKLDELIAEWQGMFKGQPPLEDDLYQMRREEEEHSRRKYGC